MSAVRCILGKLQAEPIDKEQVKRDGWKDDGILVISHDDTRLNWLERESIKQIGEKLYGPSRRG